MLVWSACPVCNESWSEEVPEVGDRTNQLVDLVKDELKRMARFHKSNTHDVQNILSGEE